LSKLSKIRAKYNVYLKFCLFITYFFLIVFYSKVSSSNNFLECIDDIPISADFKENMQECFNFDSDTGKISLAEAITSMKPSNIIAYYLGILPSFGWNVKEVSKKESFIIFNRDQDVLKISIRLIEDEKFIIYFNFLSLIK